MEQPTSLKWGLVLGLAALALIRPLLSIAGAYGAAGERPWAPILVTVAIGVFWVGVVVVVHAPNPLLTLATAGGLYGVFAILFQQIVWNLLLGGAPEGAPSPAPVLAMSWTSILVTNTIWGAFLGLVATALHLLLPRRGADV